MASPSAQLLSEELVLASASDSTTTSSTTERVCSAQDRVRCNQTLSKVTRRSGGRAGPSPGSETQGQHRAPGHTTPAAVFKGQSQG